MSSILHATHAASARPAARFLAPLAAIAIGLAFVYVAGFAQAHALHAGAHDARHAAAFPCH